MSCVIRRKDVQITCTRYTTSLRHNMWQKFPLTWTNILWFTNLGRTTCSHNLKSCTTHVAQPCCMSYDLSHVWLVTKSEARFTKFETRFNFSFTWFCLGFVLIWFQIWNVFVNAVLEIRIQRIYFRLVSFFCEFVSKHRNTVKNRNERFLVAQCKRKQVSTLVWDKNKQVNLSLFSAVYCMVVNDVRINETI